MEPDNRLLRIGELERRSGVPRYTIHQYVRSGLLPEPLRTSKTMAYYNDTHLERLQAIREIKGPAKLPLSFLKKVLDDMETSNDERDIDMHTAGSGEPFSGSKEKRREEIKKAALKVFLEKGFQNARIQDITAAAGISTGTFYIYYRDKKELFMAVIDELTRNTVAAIEDAAEKEDDLLLKAAATARFYIDNYLYFSGIINQLRGMMATEEPMARDKYIALHNQLAHPIMRGISTAIDRGLIRDVDPELLARAIMGMVEFISFRLTFDEEYTSTQAISFMTDLIMNGIGMSR
jgi:AcrR family transcriptional regulator/predicted DNA-binding transcriptional regulator AlpA